MIFIQELHSNEISHLRLIQLSSLYIPYIYINVFAQHILKDSFFVVVGDSSFQSAKALLKDIRSPQLVTDFVVRMISLERVL